MDPNAAQPTPAPTPPPQPNPSPPLATPSVGLPNNAPTFAPNSATVIKPHKSSTPVLIGILVLVVVLGGGGFLAYKFYSQSQLQTPQAAVYTPPSVSKPALAASSSATNPNDTSDTALNQDAKSIDDSLNSADSELNNVDQSLNDQEGDLSGQ